MAYHQELINADLYRVICANAQNHGRRSGGARAATNAKLRLGRVFLHHAVCCRRFRYRLNHHIFFPQQRQSMWSFNALIVFYTVLLVLIFGDCVDERVLLQDVNTITLREGQYTTGRRVAPVPQLKCVGGGACYKYQPRVVQCVKQGYDGSDYQWKCTADMPRQYKFGMVTVTCEGYNYPDDPYILKGSCGLEYELEYAEPAKEVGRSKMKWPSLFSWPRWLTSENIVNVIVVLFIIYVIYSMLSSSGSPGRTTPRYGWFGGGFDGGPGFGGGYPGAHPRPSAPPSYEDTMGFKSAYSTPSSSSGPGFWTGAGLGALGGYLFGRNTNSSPYGFRRADEHFLRTTDANYADFDQPSSSEMRESTGFGGTRRR